jgi:beta-lactam-binding protein with PASTA domain
MKKWIENITRRPLWVNMLAALGVVLLFLLIFFATLSWLTGHGKIQRVPSITGQNILSATKTLEAAGFEVVIQDSVFIDTLAKQAVVRQIPEAESMVKNGRAIYLTERWHRKWKCRIWLGFR